LSKNTTCFGHILYPSSGVFYGTFDSGIFLGGLMTASKQVQDEFHPDPAWKLPSKLQEIYQCRMYSRRLMMMDKGNARNM